MKSKIISAAIALAYLVTGSFSQGSIWTLRSTGGLVLALACIWFSDAMGGYMGGVGRGRIDAPTPACLVAACGWVLLVSTIIVGCVTMSKT